VTSGSSADHVADRHLAQRVHELALPTPFSLRWFPRWLERRNRRRTRLVAASMEPGGPSGVLVQAPGTDYLYYEKQTSLLHQAHIVLCLAARLLLADRVDLPIDARVIPKVSPWGVHLMLGQQPAHTLTDREAEDFAFLVLDRERSYPSVLASRASRQLRPLDIVLSETLESTRNAPTSTVRQTARARLYQRVIAIRDAMIALKAYRDPGVAARAAAAADWSGLVGREKLAAIEAAVLASAIQCRQAGLPASRLPAHAELPSLSGDDLRGEVNWLAMVTRAWAQLPGSTWLSPEGEAGTQRDGFGPAAGTRSLWLRCFDVQLLANRPHGDLWRNWPVSAASSNQAGCIQPSWVPPVVGTARKRGHPDRLAG